MDFLKLKKFFLFNLIGALIISAIVAIVLLVVEGEFREIARRVLFTLLVVVAYSLVGLAFIWDDSRQNTFERLAFFTNVLFLLFVAGFITSILGLWGVISGGMVVNLYQTYFVVGFASLHSDILPKALRKENYMDMVICLNYMLIGIFVLLLLPIIYIYDAFNVFGEAYYWFLGAAGITNGTLGLLVIIFYRLYMHDHPEEQNVLAGGVQMEKTQKKGFGFWVWILIIYLLLQVILPLIFYWGILSFH